MKPSAPPGAFCVPGCEAPTALSGYRPERVDGVGRVIRVLPILCVARDLLRRRGRCRRRLVDRFVGLCLGSGGRGGLGEGDGFVEGEFVEDEESRDGAFLVLFVEAAVLVQDLADLTVGLLLEYEKHRDGHPSEHGAPAKLSDGIRCVPESTRLYDSSTGGRGMSLKDDITAVGAKISKYRPGFDRSECSAAPGPHWFRLSPLVTAQTNAGDTSTDLTITVLELRASLRPAPRGLIRPCLGSDARPPSS